MPRRQAIVSLCLLALLLCQWAMAAQWCHAGAELATPSASSCHGQGDAGANGDNDLACPASQALPELGKLPLLVALPLGHDFAVRLATSHRHIAQPQPAQAARAGPQLDELCRRLI